MAKLVILSYLAVLLLFNFSGCVVIQPEVAVWFDSCPAGASLWIDGQTTDYHTPVEVALKPGRHMILLKKYSFANWEADILVEKGKEQQVIANLTAAPEQETIMRLDGQNGQDASVLAFHPYTNYGLESSLGVGSNLNPYQNLIYRSYLQFDLSDLPDEIQLIEAKLGLFFNSDGKPTLPAEIAVYPILSEWQEDEITWEFQPEIASDPVGFTVVPPILTNAYVWWHITSLVEQWHQLDLINYGLMLKDPDENSIDGGKGFASSESDQENQRPCLILRYYQPH